MISRRVYIEKLPPANSSHPRNIPYDNFYEKIHEIGWYVQHSTSVRHTAPIYEIFTEEK